METVPVGAQPVGASVEAAASPSAAGSSAVSSAASAAGSSAGALLDAELPPHAARPSTMEHASASATTFFFIITSLSEFTLRCFAR
jgi:hypothetical protein